MSGDTQISPCRLALLTDFTPDFLASELRKIAESSSLSLDIHLINPGNWQSEILQQESALYTFNPDVVLIGCSGPMQWSRFSSDRNTDPGLKLLEEYLQIWDTLRKRLPHVEIWQSELGPFPDGLGDAVDPSSFSAQRAIFNEGIFNESSSRSHVSLVDWVSGIHQTGTRQAYDNRLWHTAAHPFALDFLPELAKPIIKRLMWRSGRFIKVVVVDLDETLWGGIVGDLGSSGIQIGQEGIGNIFRHFQIWVKLLKHQGILVAVASHNTEESARQAFDNPEHVLTLEDFAAFRASWDPKSVMIREIAEELNIGLDAFCFLDNSVFVRNEVRSALPQVSVPELPDDPSEWLEFLSSASLFESGTGSEANAHRTRWIQEAGERDAKRQGFENYEDYLSSLKMQGRLRSLKKEHIPRAHQLIMRTNQFNLRTIRHSKATLEKMLSSENWLSYFAGLEDCFGDYGWIGLLLIERDSPESDCAFLDTWIMSCRVFERGMEYWTFTRLIEELRTRGISTLDAEFVPSAKNGKFSGLLGELGFTPTSGGRCRLDLTAAPLHETHIESQ